ncbi:MAG: hypothetical protein GY861_21675 [bacterium]|nr:hypothetical protein [bacterium]
MEDLRFRNRQDFFRDVLVYDKDLKERLSFSRSFKVRYFLSTAVPGLKCRVKYVNGTAEEVYISNYNTVYSPLMFPFPLFLVSKLKGNSDVPVSVCIDYMLYPSDSWSGAPIGDGFFEDVIYCISTGDGIDKSSLGFVAVDVVFPSFSDFSDVDTLCHLRSSVVSLVYSLGIDFCAYSVVEGVPNLFSVVSKRWFEKFVTSYPWNGYCVSSDNLVHTITLGFGYVFGC